MKTIYKKEQNDDTLSKLRFIENAIFENYYTYYKNKDDSNYYQIFNDVANSIREGFIEQLSGKEKKLLHKRILIKRKNFITILNFIGTKKNVNIITLLDLAEQNTSFAECLKNHQIRVFGREL